MKRPSMPSTKLSPRTLEPGANSRARSTQGRPRSSRAAARVMPAPRRSRVPRSSVSEPRKQPVSAIWKRYHEAREEGHEESTERWRNELMEHYLPLVKSSAERLLRTLPNSIELDDLISAGLFGLMDAIRRFDATRGIKFSTYCGSRVRGSILDQLRTEDWVPRLVRRRASSIEKESQRLAKINGRAPSHLELADQLEMDDVRFSKEIKNADISTLTSLSTRLGGDDSDAEISDVLPAPRSEEPLMAVSRGDMFDEITRSVSPRERTILVQYYQRGLTLREIGEMLDLTESRVCQIHANAMDSLRLRLGTREKTLLM